MVEVVGEKVDKSPEPDVQEIPETADITKEIERAGVTSTQTQFTAQVNDDKGQPLIHSSHSNVTITLPTDPESLKGLAKGSVTNAVTWLAMFWLRMMKK